MLHMYYPANVLRVYHWGYGRKIFRSVKFMHN